MACYWGSLKVESGGVGDSGMGGSRRYGLLLGEDSTMEGSWMYGLEACDTVAWDGAGGMAWRRGGQLHGRELEVWSRGVGDSGIDGAGGMA